MSPGTGPSLADVPEALLAIIVESARTVVGARDPDRLVAGLRPLARFDSRAAASATVRRQFVAALERDGEFRAEVATAIVARAEVAALLAAWSRETALEVVAGVDERGDLALVAATLWAGAPDGWEFGLGAVGAMHRARGAAEALAAELEAIRLEAAAADAERQRAEQLVETRDTRVAELADELRAERAARRGRERDADAAAASARTDADAARAAAAASAQRVEALDRQIARDRRRIADLEAALTQARDDNAAPPAGSAKELAALADNAADLARRLRAAATPSAAITNAAAAEGSPRRPPPAARPAAPTGRSRPRLPGGLVADTVDGAMAMLGASDGVTFVVDGYNVSHQAWPDTTPSMQRDRLDRALHQLHLRFGCDVVCCYDGDGTEGVRPRRLPGLRVRFSDAGHEADELVVDTVESFPKRVPVVVASSDAWVREHAEAAGARVISANTAVALTRSSGRR